MLKKKRVEKESENERRRGAIGDGPIGSNLE